MKFTLATWLSAALVVVGHIAVGQSRSSAAVSLQYTLDSLLSVTGIPAISFAYSGPDGDVIHVVGGKSDLEKNESAKPDMRMFAGSTGKTFFAALAMMAVDEGKLKLDDRISKYLSAREWFAGLPNHESITVRMLLNHTSGLEEYYEIGNFIDQLLADRDRQWDHADQIKLLHNRKALFEAGKGWGYADTNYLVLAFILESVFERPLHDEIENRLLKKHNLQHTMRQDKGELKDLANGYVGEGNPFKINGAALEDGRHKINPQIEGAGGGFISSSRDLARWAKIYYAASFLDDTTLRHEMREGVVARTGKDHQYGLGMQIRPAAFGTGFGHSGWFPGYLTDMEYFPDSRISAAIQINTDDGKRLRSKSPRYYMMVLMKKAQSINR